MIQAAKTSQGSGLLRKLRGNEDGATLVEFAFVAPILITMLMGVFDISHQIYTSAMLNGAMQKAGRDMTLENAGGNQTSIDALVRKQVHLVIPNGNVQVQKLSHFDFSDIGQPELFTDQNGDGACDNGEPFEDANDNGTWDPDRGKTGIGGARDAVVYRATVTYPRLFPMAELIGLKKNITLQASTVLRNQPYDNQNRTVTIGNC